MNPHESRQRLTEILRLLLDQKKKRTIGYKKSLSTKDILLARENVSVATETDPTIISALTKKKPGVLPKPTKHFTSQEKKYFNTLKRGRK